MESRTTLRTPNIARVRAARDKLREISAEHRRRAAELRAPGRFMPHYRDESLELLRGEMRDRVAAIANDAERHIAAVLEATPEPPSRAALLQRAAEALDPTAALRIALTLSRTSDADLVAVLDRATQARDRATLAELHREAKFRAAIGGVDQRIFVARVEAAVDELPMTDLDELVAAHAEAIQLRDDFNETLRAALDGDEDRSARWAAARALDAVPRQHPLVLRDGALALDPRDQPAA